MIVTRGANRPFNFAQPLRWKLHRARSFNSSIYTRSGPRRAPARAPGRIFAGNQIPRSFQRFNKRRLAPRRCGLAPQERTRWHTLLFSSRGRFSTQTPAVINTLAPSSLPPRNPLPLFSPHSLSLFLSRALSPACGRVRQPRNFYHLSAACVRCRAIFHSSRHLAAARIRGACGATNNVRVHRNQYTYHTVGDSTVRWSFTTRIHYVVRLYVVRLYESP